jgi:ADP-dependent NAD(P)H-hydrate dehydratase / NAD(P)H-hydrate epimerase
VKVLTAAQMREVDRLTIQGGIPSLELMENAGRRVLEVLEREFAPLQSQRILVLCGKGNNGGDGLVVARLLRRAGVEQVYVVLAAQPDEYAGDAKVNLERLAEAGLIPTLDIPQTPERREATIVVDALLGTGLKGPASGRVLELIRATRDFPVAKMVAVDLPSGLGGGGECVRAGITVTFTAPKIEHYLADGSGDAVGRLIVTQIGSPAELVPGGLETSLPSEFASLFAARKREAHKGDFGHVLVVGGAPGKVGAAAMSGLAAARMGAGLTTVACSDSSRLAPELMTEPLHSFSLERKTVIAIGPGLGKAPELVARVLSEAKVPVVIDADALNAIAGTDFRGRGVETVLTPHPGEMGRLLGGAYTDPVATARAFARERNVCLVLKGHRTLIAVPEGIAAPEGQAWINLSGTPAMGKGGSGDILTGMIAGMIAQFPGDIATAVRAAVWLHGKSGELAAEELTEKCVLATDLLLYLPKAIRGIAP